jgi:hypothetical protein
MAFLDNSGDIILDAVLTDAGRYHLAKADGNFSIVKFALGDDEIDYGKYDKDNISGSAYYDLEIMKTPVLEALANDSSNMNSMLLNIQWTDYLYLPVIELNTLLSDTKTYSTIGAFLVLTTTDSADAFAGAFADGIPNGVMLGVTQASSVGSTSDNNYVRLDQGLNTAAIPPSAPLSSELKEIGYVIQMDSRFGQLTDTSGNPIAESVIDDDNIATYIVNLDSAGNVVLNNTDETQTNQVIQGPRGTLLQFKLRSTNALNTSDYLYQQLGTTIDLPTGAGGTDEGYYMIDTTIKITGFQTGFKVDVPVRYVKRCTNGTC